MPTVHRADLYIGPLREALIARRLGVRVLTGLRGNLSIPKYGSGLETGWVAEGGAVPEGDMAFDSVGLEPKHVGGKTEMSRQLIQQSSPEIEQLVRDDLAFLIAKQIDRAIIAGTGTNNEPLGVLNFTGAQPRRCPGASDGDGRHGLPPRTSLRDRQRPDCLIGQADDVWCVQPHFWTPKQGLQDRERRDRAPYLAWAQQGFLRVCDGAAIDYEQVASDMAEILADVDIQAVAFDRWRMDVLKRELDRLGLDFPLVEWGQGFKDMSPALDALEAALLNGEVAHGNHPVLTWCAANATTTKDPAGNRKLDKSRQTGRIDGLQAMAMAFGVATRTEQVQGIPDEIFFI